MISFDNGFKVCRNKIVIEKVRKLIDGEKVGKSTVNNIRHFPSSDRKVVVAFAHISRANVVVCNTFRGNKEKSESKVIVFICPVG